MRNLFRKGPSYVTVPAQARAPAAEASDSLWVRCENERCRELLYVREFENNLKVCHKCEHHARLSARERVSQLADEDSFVEHDADLAPADPLDFVAAGEAYRRKVQESFERTGEREAAVCGSALLDGQPLELVVLDFAFMGASMGSVVGEKIARACDRAGAAGSALVTVNASGGARMHEGIFSLMQMAKTVTALAALGSARVPHLSVLVDPTLGGVTASYAGVGDVIVAEHGALVGFAGPRVIEQITKQKLPPDAQRAAFLLEHGMVDLVVQRRELRPTLTRLLRLYCTGHRFARPGLKFHGVNPLQPPGQDGGEGVPRAPAGDQTSPAQQPAAWEASAAAQSPPAQGGGEVAQPPPARRGSEAAQSQPNAAGKQPAVGEHSAAAQRPPAREPNPAAQQTPVGERSAAPQRPQAEPRNDRSHREQ